MVDETTPVTGVQTIDISTAGISSFSQNAQEGQVGVVQPAEVVAPVANEVLGESSFDKRLNGFRLRRLPNLVKGLGEKAKGLIKDFKPNPQPVPVPVRV